MVKCLHFLSYYNIKLFLKFVILLRYGIALLCCPVLCFWPSLVSGIVGSGTKTKSYEVLSAASIISKQHDYCSRGKKHHSMVHQVVKYPTVWAMTDHGLLASSLTSLYRRFSNFRPFLSISVSSDWVLQYWSMGKPIQMSSSAHGVDPVPVGKSANIRAILMYTRKNSNVAPLSIL